MPNRSQRRAFIRDAKERKRHTRPRDLDYSDVIADADEQFERWLGRLVDEPRVELEHLRYAYGIDARFDGDRHAIAVVRTIDFILGAGHACYLEFGEHDHDPARCQRILDDMAGSWDDGLADAFNREAEESYLGRPLFPNEY